MIQAIVFFPLLGALVAGLLGRVIGHRASEFFEGESLATLRAQIERRRRGETSTYEIDIRRPDGSVVHCVNAATPLPDAEGRPAGSVGIWTDITRRHEAEEAQDAHLPRGDPRDPGMREPGEAPLEPRSPRPAHPAHR